VPGFENLKIDEYLREPNFNFIEKQIFEAARHEARHPTRIPDGELREVKTSDVSGRQISEFFGKPSSWMSTFSTGAANKKLIGIRTETQRGYHPNM
jgi:hypothetical protein